MQNQGHEVKPMEKQGKPTKTDGKQRTRKENARKTNGKCKEQLAKPKNKNKSKKKPSNFQQWMVPGAVCGAWCCLLFGLFVWLWGLGLEPIDPLGLEPIDPYDS